jgi:D-arabinose 1-dehydrogenase-like Zn-dependent alcohol dehydrogenase
MPNNESEASPLPSAAKAAPVVEGQSATTERVKHAVEGRVGIVGLGHMGKAMATNLAAAGREVVAYVCQSEQLGPLVTLGLSPTTNISDVCACEFIITMLPDGDACVAPEGYKDFDDGAASKFVIDPHEQLKAA